MARVSIDQTVHEFYRELTEKGATRPPLFRTMKDAFMFCFAMGARNGIKEPVASQIDIFGTEVFDPDSDVPLLNGMFISDLENIAGLSSEQGERISAAVLTCAEQYANAGARIVRRAFNSIEPEVSLVMLLAVGDVG